MNQQNRYNRQLILPEIGSAGQRKLTVAKVLVIGSGGLGCPVLQYLAAAGIGTIGIADMDTVSESNLQRQVLFTEADIGKNKALAASSRLKALNSKISIQAFTQGLNQDNALSLIKQFDLVVDGSDNFETRYLVNDACVQAKKPWVFGAIYKFQGQWGVFNYNRSATYRCLFPSAPKANTVPGCNQIGVLGVVPGIVGLMQANHVLHMLLFPDKVIAGILHCFDSLTSQIEKIEIQPNAKAIALAGSIAIDSYNYGEFCGINSQVKTIELPAALNLPEVTFVDVRNADELPKIKGVKVLEIPLGEIESTIKLLSTNSNYVLFCQSGIRSKQAAELLNQLGFSAVYNLNQGAPEIVEHLMHNKPVLK